jgi:hypothetical protein
VNSLVRARIPAIACAVALAPWCFFVFRGAWIDLARADHLALLEERLFFQTRAAYAWHLLGYQRTRILSGEDLVLSRPLFDAWHAALEGLLEVDGLERGLIGISVHALIVVAVFRFAHRWLPIGLALLASLAIASPLPGIDLVIWRHATPYGLAVCFLAFAAAELSSVTPSRRKVLGWLTLSALAHETMIAVLAGAALTALALLPGERKRTWLLWTLVPIAVCGAVYAALAVLFPLASSAPHSASGLSVTGLTWLPRVTGLAVLAWVAPWSFQVALDPWARAFVSAVRVPEALVLVLGGVAVVFGIAAVVTRVRSFVREDRPEHAVALLVGGYLLAGIGLLCFGRLGTRGPAYLSSSGYYFQIWGVCLEMLIVLAVGVRLQRHPPAPLAVTALGACAMSSLAASAVVWPLALGQREFARASHELDRQIVAALDEHPAWCFAGTVDERARSLFAPATPYAPLGRRVCSVRPDREPVVLATRDGRIALVPLSMPVATESPASSGVVSVRIEHGTNVILRVDGASSFAVAYVGHELHVARDGTELADQTDVVPVADASGPHTMALAVIEGRVRAIFDGMLEGDLGPAASLDGAVSVVEMDGSPKGIGPVTRSPEAPELILDRAAILEAPFAEAFVR